MQFSWKSLFTYSFSRIIPGIAGLLAVSIYSRIFEPNEYGQYSIVLAFISLLVLLGTTQIKPTILRFYAKYERSGKTAIFFANIIIYQSLILIAISILLLLLNYLFGSVIPVKFQRFTYFVLILFISSGFFESLVNFYRSADRSLVFTILYVTYAVLRHGLAILFCFLIDSTLENLFYGFIVASTLIDLTIVILLIRQFGFKMGYVNKSVLKSHILFSAPLLISSISFWLINFSDRFLIEMLRNSSEVGLYSAGFSMAERGMKLIVSIMMLQAYPLLSYSVENYSSRMTSELLTNLSEKYLTISVPLFLIITFLSDDIVSIYLDKEFIGSSNILPLLTFSFLVLGLAEYGAKGFELSTRTKYMAFIALLSGFFSICLNIFIIPQYGYIGAAVVSNISVTIYLLMIFILVQKFFRWRIRLKYFLKLMLPVLILLLIIQICNNVFNSLLPRLVCSIIFSGFGYFITAYQLDLFKEN